MKITSVYTLTPVLFLGVISCAFSAEISGTMTLLGCPTDLPHIVLQATPVLPPGSQGTIVAKLSSRTDGSISFTFPNAQAGQVYGMQAKVTTNKCGKVVWHSPNTGMVFAGQTNAKIDGVAVRQQIEIWGTKKPGRDAETWLGIDTVDTTQSMDYMRRMRIYTDVPNVSAFQLQTSRRPFNTDTSPFAGVAGSISPAESACQIDSQNSALVRSQRWSVTGSSKANGWFEFSGVNLLSLMTVPVQFAASPGGSSLPVQQDQPLYVRAIPITTDASGDHRHCSVSQDGLPGWVILQSASNITVTDPHEDPSVTIDSVVYKPPTVRDYPDSGKTTCYRTVKEHIVDPNLAQLLIGGSDDVFGSYYWLLGGSQYGTGVVTYYHPGQKIPKNSVVCATYDPDNMTFLEELSGLVTGFIDALGYLVSQVALGYDLLKNATVQILADGISVIADCDDTCKYVISEGITVGLMALGMPPSIPSWDEIKQDGLSYLAAEMVEEAGVDPDTAQKIGSKAVELAQEMIDKLSDRRGGHGGLPDWLTYDIGFYPAVMNVTLRENNATRTTPWTLTIPKSTYFMDSTVKIPKTFRPTWPAPYDHTMTFPIVLQPRWYAFMPCGGMTEGCTEYAAAVYLKDGWRKKVEELKDYHNGYCILFEPEILRPTGALFADQIETVKLGLSENQTVAFSPPIAPGSYPVKCQ